MDDFLRFSGAVERCPAVEAWLAARPGELGVIARQWFAQLRQCGADVRELVHDGCVHVCVEDAPFAYVNVFKNHVNVGFFQGATLPDPRGLLAGSGKRMRHVKLKPGSAPHAEAICDLIDAAYVDIRARLGHGRSSPQ